MKNIKWVLGICFIIFFNVIFYLKFYPIKVVSIDYTVEDKKIYAKVTFPSVHLKGQCSYKDEIQPIVNNTCQFEVLNEEGTFQVETLVNKKEFILNPNQNEVLDIFLEEDKAYMVVGESKKIEFSTEEIGNPSLPVVIKSENEEVLKVEDDVIKALKSGSTKVVINVGNVTKTMDVIVTDLLTKPILAVKPYLPCNRYNDAENKLIDEFLQYRINKAGYQTRGAVVATLRFLTLEFPYQIHYFWENGRLHNNTGGPAADGEGRFYHQGLYLSESKFNDLNQSKIRYGPAIWGCPLMNWEDDPTYGFHAGVKAPNGLDCSGFVTWVLFNAGFDVKDIGAGDTPSVSDDLGDLGVHQPITMELLKSNKIKPGDIIAADGHVALVGGVKDGYIYVAESLNYGLRMNTYSYEKLLNTSFLTYVINMDNVYQKEGVYTNYWE